MNNNKHHQKLVQFEFNEYGIENFNFNVLESFNNYIENIAKQLEDDYILKLRKNKSGFKQKTNLEIGENYVRSVKNNDKKEHFYININEVKLLNLNDQMFFRLLYIASHMDYNNVVRINMGGKNRCISKRDLSDMLNISDRRSFETLKEFFDKKIIYLDNDIIKVNKKLFKKGTIYNNNESYIKIYKEFVQKEYISSTTSLHKSLGIILKLMPYCHKETNVLCFNPTEKVFSEIKPLNKSDIVKILERRRYEIGFLSNMILRADGYELKNTYIFNPEFIYNGYDFEDINIKITDMVCK